MQWKMSRASVGCSQPRPCSGEKTLRRCRNRRETDNVVLIDVDSDSLHNVIIIDVPESSQNKFSGSSVLRNNVKGPWTTVICLDDDEMEVDENVENGASSSKRTYPMSANFASSSNSVADDCQFVRENSSPVKLSKGKRTYSGKGSTNRYGLGADTDSGSSDSDYLDCELMEGPSGRLREQWEKASLKRKCDTRNGQSGVKDPEKFFSGGHENISVANGRGQPKETASVDKDSIGKKDPAHSILKGDGNLGCSYSKSNEAAVDNDDLLKAKLEAQFPDGKVDSPCRRDSFTEEPPHHHAELHNGHCFEKGGSSFHNEEEQVPHRPDFVSGRDWCTSQVNHVDNAFQNKEKASVAEPDLSTAVPCNEKNFYDGNANTVEKESRMSLCQFSVNHDFGHGKPISGYKGKISQETITDQSTSNTNDHHVNNVQSEQSHSCSVSATKEPLKLVLHSQIEESRDDLVHGLDGDVMLTSEGSNIMGREKLKETDEYKKASEEEWASRQRALQIQAEEAQNLRRLRKRKKAESMRLLDMERRQKQRVEEIRETQKKDEQNMNLKEVIRAAVIRELNLLELTCHDMASLLRGLGILVGVVGQHPSPDEVRSAYKKALLAFHPDRASRSDIRQQVEAEEKFKLISRMKDKLLPTLQTL